MDTDQDLIFADPGLPISKALQIASAKRQCRTILEDLQKTTETMRHLRAEAQPIMSRDFTPGFAPTASEIHTLRAYINILKAACSLAGLSIGSFQILFALLEEPDDEPETVAAVPDATTKELQETNSRLQNELNEAAQQTADLIENVRRLTAANAELEDRNRNFDLANRSLQGRLENAEAALRANREAAPKLPPPDPTIPK